MNDTCMYQTWLALWKYARDTGQAELESYVYTELDYYYEYQYKQKGLARLSQTMGLILC